MQLHMKKTSTVLRHKNNGFIIAKSRFFLIIALIITAIATTSCDYSSLAVTNVSASDDIKIDNTKPNDSTDVSAEPETPKTFYNYLTGLTTSEINSGRRPVSFCTQNYDGCVPYGLKLADIIIEAPSAEGKTSVCVMTTDYENAKRIGAVSALPSCLSEISSAFGAIKVYSGLIGNTNVDDNCSLDALSCNSSVFFRDNNIGSSDNLMADGSHIAESVSNLGYTPDISSSYVSPYIVDNNVVYERNSAAKYITVPYWSTLKVNFSYDSNSDKYIRMQNSKIYRDGDNSELTYKTVFILFCDTTTVSTHSGSTISLDMSDGGDGYVIFGGKAVEMSWKRDENGNLIFSAKDGSSLKIPSGNIYIGLLQISNKKDLIIGN